MSMVGKVDSSHIPLFVKRYIDGQSETPTGTVGRHTAVGTPFSTQMLG